jgi:hypothetical protein
MQAEDSHFGNAGVNYWVQAINLEFMAMVVAVNK